MRGLSREPVRYFLPSAAAALDRWFIPPGPYRDHDVLHASAEQVAGVLALGVHGVDGHDHARQIGEGLQQRLEAGDLVGLLTNVEWGQVQAGEARTRPERWSQTASG